MAPTAPQLLSDSGMGYAGGRDVKGVRLVGGCGRWVSRDQLGLSARSWCSVGPAWISSLWSLAAGGVQGFFAQLLPSTLSFLSSVPRKFWSLTTAVCGVLRFIALLLSGPHLIPVHWGSERDRCRRAPQRSLGHVSTRPWLALSGGSQVSPFLRCLSGAVCVDPGDYSADDMLCVTAKVSS